LLAIPKGLYFLATTHGVKRWIVPPALITFAAFIGLTWWLWKVVEGWTESLSGGLASLPDDAAWWWRALEWVLERSAFLVLAKLGGLTLVLAVGFFAMLWTFSLVYEVISGPFLDEIHGRIEKRWYGIDPRNEREAPRGIAPGEIGALSALAGAASLAFVAAGIWAGGELGWKLALGGPVVALVVTCVLRRDYARWLAWRAGVELRTLAVSLQATAISAMMLVFALPLLFVPVVGYPLFGLAAGFTTAISLLDIPMSRRRWPLSTRVSFLFQQMPAILVFGVVASVLYMVPVVGPLVMVPAASVGGLWLFCRLDKSGVR
jgi:uncharacterized protein involved in cysteine biosynthesis